MTEGSEPTTEIGTPAPTAVLQAPRDGSPRALVVGLTFLAVAAGAFLVGIATASTFRSEPPGAVLASDEVGGAGGTVRFDGGEIRVPPGALRSTTEFVVRRTLVPRRVRVRPPGGSAQVFEPRQLVAYVFEPRDVSFLRPVSILFRLRARSGGAATFARIGNTTVVLDGKVDADRGTVEVQVSDFRFNRGRPIGAGR